LPAELEGSLRREVAGEGQDDVSLDEQAPIQGLQVVQSDAPEALGGAAGRSPIGVPREEATSEPTSRQGAVVVERLDQLALGLSQEQAKLVLAERRRL